MQWGDWYFQRETTVVVLLMSSEQDVRKFYDVVKMKNESFYGDKKSYKLVLVILYNAYE